MHDLERLMWSTIPFAIPIIAIIGGITLAIIRTTGQQRLAELERRERIAAIERGVDPSKLPPMVGPCLVVFLSSVEPDKRIWAIGLMPFLGGVALLISAKVIWPPSDAK